MSRKVLLVDPDVNALGALAADLRAHGVTVSLASDPASAVEQAFQSRPDVILVARKAGDGAGDLGDLGEAFQKVPELASTPRLYLVRGGLPDQLGPDEVLRADLDRVISRIAEVSPKVERPALDQEIRGTIESMPLVDLLQLLGMNRRSGVLSLMTPSGAGEVRLGGGEVVDAVFRRLEGEKALYRLFGEREGRFSFSAGDPGPLNRIAIKGSQLFMEAMHQVDEVKRRRAELSPAGEALLLDDLPPNAGAHPSSPREALLLDLGQLLQIPRSLDEILDDLPMPDLMILDELGALMSAGKLRRVPIAELTTPFAAAEQLPMLRSLVVRLTRAGYSGPPRLVIAAAAKRMPALSHSIRRISDAAAPAEASPRAPLPRSLGTLRLGDGVELEICGLPAEEAYSPTWSLTLPGAAAVVRLGEAGGASLEAHCEAVEVALVDAESVMGAVDPAVPAQVAALVRGALSVAAGV
ncbi:MAG: DUF4388 domain-containing protein [Byssovorax sp.]